MKCVDSIFLMGRGSGSFRRALLGALAFVCALQVHAQPADLLGGLGSEAKRELLREKLQSDIQKVDHAIELTKEAMRDIPDSVHASEMMFRLAELYVERSRYVHNLLREEQLATGAETGGEAAREVVITKQLAIEVYDRLLKDYPKFARKDEVLFFKAHEFRELRKLDLMLKAFEELMSAFPTSDWSQEARAAIAEEALLEDDFERAEKYYLEILAQREGHLHDLARNRLGWMRINEEKFEDAFKYFEAAVKSPEKKKKGAVGAAATAELKRESLVALTWPYSEVRKARAAPTYFRKLARNKSEYLAALKKLARRYYVKSEFEKAALIYRPIVALSTLADENIDYVQRIYDAFRKLPAGHFKRYPYSETDVAAMVENLGRLLNDPSLDNTQRKELLKAIELRARDVATKFQNAAKAKRDQRGLRRSAEAYDEYLWGFRELVPASRRQDIGLNRAQALQSVQNHYEAARQFEQNAKWMKEGNEQRDQLYNAIAAYYQSIDADALAKDKSEKGEGILNPLERMRAREGLKQLGAYFIRTWPQDASVPVVKFNIASMYYQQAQYSRAAELFEAFLKEHPSHKEATNAGNLALDAYAQLDDYEALAAFAQKLAANTRLPSALREQAKRTAEGARNRKVELVMLESSSSASEDFDAKMMAQWEKNKGTAEGEDFLYTAFVAAKDRGNVEGVYSFGGKMIGAYPQSKRLVDVIATMGLYADRAADFERAAVTFAEFYKRFPSHTKAKEFLKAAADMRLGLGNYRGAVELYQKLAQVGNAGQRQHAYARLLDLYEEVQDWSRLAGIAARNSNSARAAVALGFAQSELGQDRAAEQSLRRAVRMPVRGDEDAGAVAKAYFLLGRYAQQRYEQVQFSGAQGAERALAQKQRSMQQMSDLYLAAIQKGGGKWGIAAIHALAQANDEFGRFIENAPMPSGMNAAQQNQYRSALNQQAGVYRNEAQNILSTCAKKAKELAVISNHAKACLSRDLNDAEPLRIRTRPSSARARYEEDAKRLRRAIVEKPADTSRLIALAKTALGAGDFHVARMTLEKVLQRKAGNLEALNLLGVAAWAMNDVDAAYDFLNRAKGNANGRANLIGLLMQFGHKAKAQALARKLNRSQLDSSALHPFTKQGVGR